MMEIINSILEWHYAAGGNFQGFVFGVVFITVASVFTILYFRTASQNQISDEDFFSIVLDDEHEIHNAMDKDDDYS